MAGKVIISKSKLVALGDVIREKTGSSEKMTVDVMTETMRNHSGGKEEITEYLTADYAQEKLPLLEGTTVPNSGVLTNVYFNTDLSIEEVEELASKLEFVELPGWYGTHCIVAGDKELYKYINIARQDGYVIISYATEDDWFQIFHSSGGWSEEKILDININLASKAKDWYSGTTVNNLGSQNELIKDLISSKPFNIRVDGFCSNIAEAIRTRKKTTNSINAQNFDDEILSIEDNAKFVEFSAKDKDIEVGASGDVYFNMNGATPEEIATYFNDIVSKYQSELENHRFQMASLFRMSDNRAVIIAYYWNFSGFSIKSMDLNNLYGMELYNSERGFVQLEDTYSMPIYSDVTIEENIPGEGITVVPVDCPELVNKLFFIGRKDVKVEAKLDITSEELSKLNKVEIITPTESKMIGGSSGESTGGASMVPVTMPYNNPNIGNMYYGMSIPIWNKIKVNVLGVLDALARLKHNTTFKDLCNNEEEAYNFLSNYSWVNLFYATRMRYYVPSEEEIADGYEGYFSDFGGSSDISVTFRLYNNDNGDYVASVVFGGMGNFPKSEVVIDLSNGVYNGIVNAGTIEYDLTPMRYDGMLSGSVDPLVIIINKILEIFCNILAPTFKSIYILFI